MLDFSKVLSSLRKSFVPRKNVDFEEQGLHIEMEPLSSFEEVKILESLKNLDGAQYMEGLKRHSLACSIKRVRIKQENGEILDLDLSVDMIDYVDDNGTEKSQSKFLYMIDFLGQWPSSIMDLLFDAFNDMNREVETRVIDSAKFERFKLTEKPPEDKAETFKPISETESEEMAGLDENERLQRKVEKEIEQETMRMSRGVEEKEIREQEELKRK